MSTIISPNKALHLVVHLRKISIYRTQMIKSNCCGGKKNHSKKEVGDNKAYTIICTLHSPISCIGTSVACDTLLLNSATLLFRFTPPTFKRLVFPFKRLQTEMVAILLAPFCTLPVIGLVITLYFRWQHKIFPASKLNNIRRCKGW